jgi:hypothetical protein
MQRAVRGLAFVAGCGALVLAVVSCGTGSPSPDDDKARLLALHEQAIRAHLEGDVDTLLAPETDEYVLVSRGELLFPTLAERAAQFGPYLAETEFTTYGDIVPPVVTVSDDGTLGWLVCRVRVEGTRTSASGETQPVDSTWAWIELYRKIDGRWRRVGNASTLAPVGPAG